MVALNFNVAPRPEPPRDDLPELRAALQAEAAAVAEALLGPPNKALSNKRQLRWGSNGSLSLSISGAKRGLWHSFEAEQGGDMLGLIRHANGCSFPDALAWARHFTGVAPDTATPFVARPAPAPEPANDHAAERESAIRKAQNLASACVPVAGTPGELYLTETRGIPAPAAGWPDAVRWKGGIECGLAVIATDASGNVQAGQIVHLNADGRKMDARDLADRWLANVKMSHGVMDGAAVRLPGDATGPLLIAEGPETGLSVWAATGHETWIALGSLAKITLAPGRKVVVCRDDDRRYSPADKKLARTLSEWRGAGIEALVATPWAARRGDASDFNDALRADGIEAVQQRIAAALHPAVAAARRRVPVATALDLLQTASGAFFDRVLSDAGEELVSSIRADVGAGKSVATHGDAINALHELRARGDNRAGVFLVPTIALADKQAAEMRDKAGGLTVAVYRGREQPDPDAPGEAMCRDLEAVADARDAGAFSVHAAVCRREMPEGTVKTCPFYGVCGSTKQRDGTADIWIAAHEHLFGAVPHPMGDVAFVVIDETMHAKGLIGAGKSFVLSVDTLTAPGDLMTAAVRQYRRRLAQAVASLPFEVAPAPVPASALRRITLGEAQLARRLEWDRLVEPAIYPGMDAEARKAERDATAENKTIAPLARVWRAVGAANELGDDGLSGWLATCLHYTKNGPVRALQIKGRKSLGKGWQVPTLLIDANLNAELVRHYWPKVELTADIAAETPNMKVRQVVDRAYALTAFEPGHNDPQEAARRAKNLRKLHAVIHREARRTNGRVLVVAQQMIEAALRDMGMPANVELAHHNAIAGRNDWQGVAALIVVGRTQPSPAAVECMAEALTGRAVDRLAGWYPRVSAQREMAGGNAVQAEVDRHPDATVEALRWQVCEGELALQLQVPFHM